MSLEELTPARYYAWRKSVEIGSKLAEHHPEIVIFYENFWTLEEIVKEFKIKTRYHSSKRVATTAVGHGISLLLPDKKRKTLRVQHHQKGAADRYSRYGSSFTTEDCQTGAKNLYENLTKYEKRAKALKAVEAQGKKRWKKKEIKSFQRMYSNSEYLIKEGKNLGLPDMIRIAIELNRRFHRGEDIRNNKSLSSYVYTHPQYF